jgi:hypothetical protein
MKVNHPALKKRMKKITTKKMIKAMRIIILRSPYYKLKINNMKLALITGVKGQDGSCLSRSLLQKEYRFMVGKEEQLQTKYW